MIRHIRFVLMLTCLCGVLWATASSAQGAPPLRVFAASSLKNALDAIGAEFTRTSGVPVAISYGATSALARQIENAAPADVFISADEDWMNYLAERQQIDPATRRNIIGNELVLIAPAGSSAAVALERGAGLAALLGADGRLAIADPRAVPAGKYAQAALENLGIWPSLEQRLARTDNVRVALQLVARGEAPLGIVYRSDQIAEPRTRLVAVFPAHLHPAIRYPAAVTVASRHASARAFVTTLGATAAADVFRREGFSALPADRAPTE